MMLRLTILLLVLTFSMAEAARPRPDGAADIAAKQASWAKHQALEEASPFAGLAWRAVGPVIQGGRVVDIEVVPGQPYTFYAAYASGGLWKTTNNGVTFEPLSDNQPTMVMGDIAVDPRKPETVWIGSGENNSSRSSYGGMGVFRSDDGGGNWRYMGLGNSDRIGRILIDPGQSERVYVAALGKLYTPGGQRGIYRTTDGGETWQQVLGGDEWTGFIDLVMKPDDPETLYAAAWERQRRAWNFSEGGNGSAIWKSTDGGTHWHRLEGGFPRGEYVGRIGLAVSAAAPDTLYASVDNQMPLPESQWDLGDRPLNAKRLQSMSKETFLRQDPDEVESFIRSSDLHPEVNAATLIEQIRNDELSIQDLLDELADANANLLNADIQGVQVWRSDDGGENWRLTHEQPLQQVVYTFGYYFGQIRVSPTDANRIYVLGVPIITSPDGGKTWHSIQGRDVHVDYQSMWIHPQYTDHIIVGNDGGMDVSYDGGKSWLKVDAQPVGQFYTVNVDMAQPYNVYGGLQDNGTIKCSARNRWQLGANCQRINGGDGMYVAVDPRDNKTTYTGFQFGNYVRLDAAGSRADARARDRLGEAALRYNWNTPVVLSPHNPDIVYFGANRLFRSLDQGRHWEAISRDLTRSSERGDVPFATLTTLSESPKRFGLIWAGTDDGQVWVTDDGGSNWHDVGDRLPRDRWVSRVEASHHVRDRAFVALNGYRNDDIRAYVYRSDDLGRRWKDIGGGLPAEAVNVIREDPVNANVLYVGTDRGVYVSIDGGEAWAALQGGLPNVPVHDLVVHPRERELVAGTHGRSIWIVDVLPIQEIAKTAATGELQVFYVDDVQASRAWRSRRSPWMYRPEDDPSAKVTFWSPARASAVIEIRDKNKHLLRQLKHDAVPGMNQFEWDLQLDQALALAAEQDRDVDTDVDTLAVTPYAESVRLGHPLYARPGEYRIRVTVGDESAENTLTIKPPRDYEPRLKPAFELRGEKK